MLHFAAYGPGRRGLVIALHGDCPCQLLPQRFREAQSGAAASDRMTRMLGSYFDDVFVVNPSRIEPATADDVADLESRLGCRMPSGYADFVERLGEGALGHFVRVLGPTELPAKTLEWRERIQEYWFWDTSE